MTDRIEKIAAEIKSLESRYAAANNRSERHCIGAALDAWRSMLRDVQAEA